MVPLGQLLVRGAGRAASLVGYRKVGDITVSAAAYLRELYSKNGVLMGPETVVLVLLLRLTEVFSILAIAIGVTKIAAALYEISKRK